MKKSLFLLFAALLPIVASAHNFMVDGIYYNITSSTDCTVEVTYKGDTYTSYNEYSGSITVPATVTYDGVEYSVTGIGDDAFCYCSSLTSITVPEGVMSIGGYAFCYCSSLTFITLPEGVTSIGDGAFEGCSSLTSITIPESVTSIGYGAFYDCSSLTSITLPEGVTSIGSSAFYNCYNLTSITLPEGVTILGESAFSWCDALTSITCHAAAPPTIGGSYTFESVDRSIPVYVPAGAVEAYQATEYWNEFTNIIGMREVLASGTCGANLTWTLYVDGELIIEGTGEMNNYALGDEVSWYSYKTSIKTVSIKEGATSIGTYAFYDCSSLTAITIPKSVTSITSNAFRGCSSLEHVSINCSNVGRWFVGNTTSIKEIILGENVTSIGINAFNGCSNLTAITSKATTPPTIGRSDTFNGVDKSIPVYVPASAVEAYQAAEYWKEFTNIIGVREVLASGTCGTNLTWTLYADGELIIEGTGEMNNYSWEDEAPWIGYATSIQTVSIKDGATSIGDDAFNNCSILTSITLPEGVTSIGSSAFYNCSSLTLITLPEGVTWIGDRAFYGCSALTSITIPNGVKTIAEFGFGWCESLQRVDIPESMENIERAAFCGCLNLNTIVIDPKNTILDDCENNAIVEKETKTLLVGTTSGYIPEGIEVIGDYAFAVRNINDIIIPNSVVSIRDCAFVGSSIRSVHIPPSVKEIDYHAFGQPRSSSECNNLEAVYIEHLEAWFEIDFEYNEENPLRVAGNLYLNGELLESISVPEGITSIKKDALHGWNGKEIILPSSVTSIGNSAFSACSSLATITCKAATPPTIGRSDTFNGVDKSIPVYVPASAVEAYKAAEYWREFNNIIGVREVLASGTCGANLTWTLYADGELVIEGTGAMNNYSSGDKVPWYSYKTSIKTVSIKEGATSIGESAFKDCSSLTAITIPKNSQLTSIEESAFWYCSSLTAITIPEGVTSIGSSAFYGCSNLTAITIPEGVTSIGEGTFHSCSSLTAITIPEGVTSIGSAAFHNCSNLTAINIPEGVMSIESSTFAYCSNLTSITIPESVTSIGSYAFQNCNSLTTINIPENSQLTSIGDYAFQYCRKLTAITIPEGMTSIENGTFRYCSGLASITCHAATPPTIGDYYTLLGVNRNIPVYVPASAVEAYKAAEYWREFNNIIGMTITTPTESFDVKIGSAGYATLYLYYAVECPRGVEAYYIIRVAGNVAVLKAIWGYIPANTGVILRGTAGTYTFVATNENVAAISDNLLQGTTEDEEILAQKNTIYYALGRVDGVVGLYRAELENGYFFNNANKAYLALTSEAEGDDDSEQLSRGFTLRFPDGSTTSIAEVMDCDASETEVIYDMQGRRLTEITEHGVYIVNGKKVWR